VMNSSLQNGAENAMSLRIGYLLPTRERIHGRTTTGSATA